MKAGTFFLLPQLVSVKSGFLLALWAHAPKNCALSLFLCFMPDANLFTASQYAAICDSLPDPAFILTESGRYAAILGGKDKRYYHDGSSLIGQRIAQVLAPAKAQWFLQQIHAALSSQQMLVVEYELSARDVWGCPMRGLSMPFGLKGASARWRICMTVKKPCFGWPATSPPANSCSSCCSARPWAMN